jgi:hypothetical protein
MAVMSMNSGMPPPLPIDKQARAAARQKEQAKFGVVYLGILLVLFFYFYPAQILLLPVALFISVALHEGGHAIAAVAGGFELRAFAVWPVKWVRQGLTWQLRWMGKSGLAGFVYASPIRVDNLRKRLIWKIAAGPAASLITGIAAITAVFLATPAYPHWLLSELKGIGFWSLIAMIPVKSKYAAADGSRLRILLRGGVAAERYTWLVVLAGESHSGLRSREMNPDVIRLLPGPLDGSLDSFGAQLLQYNWLIDTGRRQEAGEVLASVLQQDLPPQVRENLQLQMAWFQARFCGNLAAARHWMQASPVRSKKDEAYQCTLLRARAGIAFLVQRWDEAEGAAREALRHCDRLTDAGIALTIRDGILNLLDDIGAARVNPTVAGTVNQADPLQPSPVA